MAASISSGENTSSKVALTVPSAPTTKTYGSVVSLNAVVAGTGVRSEPVRTGWSWPSVYWSWYGSTLMNVISGWAAAIGFGRARGGPPGAGLPKIGVGGDRHERLFPPHGDRFRGLLK